MANKLLQGLRAADNYTRTENSAVTHKSTLNDVLDFYYHVPARRGKDNTQLFSNAYAEDPVLALKAAFYLRDIRGKGTGERESFKQVLRWLNKNRREVFNAVAPHVAEYGRWDDILEFVDNAVVVQMVVEQLDLDHASEHPSLLAKWMPSINTSNKATCELAKKWARALGMTDAAYRRMLSNLRRAINVLERIMSAGDFSVINYEHVPSKANKLYRKAFSKRDAERYVAYLEAVKKGEKKINAGTLFPYEIAAQYLHANGGYYVTYSDYDETIELLWKALPNFADTDRNAVCVLDTSASMTWTAVSGNIYPVHVALSLGIYCAERNRGAFKDYVISFNTTPELHRVRGNNLLERIQSIANMRVGGSTNIQGVFDLLLQTALRERVPAEDMPSHVFILSDMEFNSAGRNTNHEVIKQKYRAAGYELPVIVYWNIQSRNTQTPVTQDESGVILVSGLSATVFKNAINARIVTPLEAMLDVLNDERYAPVAEAVQGIRL